MNRYQKKNQRECLLIEGRVQGVGFRPMIYRLAGSKMLTGFVRNTSLGVTVEIQGPAEALQKFPDELRAVCPRQALIESIKVETINPVAGEKEFTISASSRSGDVRAGMPPDLALCALCKQELFDKANRRHRYPFINCTDCGPRFSIIRSLPYDRPLTSMAKFRMCPECQSEFSDPMNRRFEAQPNACPVCGPRISLIDASSRKIDGEPLGEAIKLLKAGGILAVKGIGGYHLCCDALNENAVRLLRERKKRPHKPFAVMFKSLAQIGEYCRINPAEAAELAGVAAPVVILKRRPDSTLPRILSPDTGDLGVFLPYSPLHCLLLEECSPLVMTSGNRIDEPIVISEDDLGQILGTIADAALVHDRPILRRCDDSVLKTGKNGTMMLRRSRGYVPAPLKLPVSGPSILACGAELKNTICITRGENAFLSAHIGDLEDYRSFSFFQETARDFMKLLEINPRIIAHDLHPDYMSTRYALAFSGADLVGVQHHHAHIASCLAEHGLLEKVIGIALDGTGFGPDGSIWGGEILIADLVSFERVGHFKQYPMPGGAQAIIEPARMALSCLMTEFGNDSGPVIARLLPSIAERERALLAGMIKRRAHSPLTSSAGRLFDAVAALLGFSGKITHEGQAAIKLQAMSDESVATNYPYEIREEQGRLVISFGPAIREITADLGRKIIGNRIAGIFHNTVASALTEACVRIRERAAINRVALSGGVFQNDLLLNKLINCLKQDGFSVYINHYVPPNDGGIAFGQAAVATANNAKR